MEWKIRCSGCGEAQPTSWLEGALIPLAGWYECFACFEKKEAELTTLQARLEAAEKKLELWRKWYRTSDTWGWKGSFMTNPEYEALEAAGEIE